MKYLLFNSNLSNHRLSIPKSMFILIKMMSNTNMRHKKLKHRI